VKPNIPYISMKDKKKLREKKAKKQKDRSKSHTDDEHAHFHSNSISPKRDYGIHSDNEIEKENRKIRLGNILINQNRPLPPLKENKLKEIVGGDSEKKTPFPYLAKDSHKERLANLPNRKYYDPSYKRCPCLMHNRDYYHIGRTSADEDVKYFFNNFYCY
jgi:hypothetical protein